MFFTLLAASTNGANVITNVDLTGSNVEVLSVDNNTGYSSMIGSNVEILSMSSQLVER